MLKFCKKLVVVGNILSVLPQTFQSKLENVVSYQKSGLIIRMIRYIFNSKI